MSMHEVFMKRALELARKAEGDTSPNPMAGAVIVRDDQIIGEGYHRACGQPHADIEAMNDVKDGDCRGATLYITMEPCCYYGRTPPSTDALIDAGIAEVYYAVPDPNPMGAGKGHRQLELAGVKVQRGAMEDEARELNRDFFHYITTGLPYVIAKYAMSMDGKIATASGDYQWVTGLESRLAVHGLRDLVDAVLVGADTIIAYDPQLTTRTPNKNGRHAKRVVLDSTGRIPLDAKVFDPKLPGETYVAAVQLSVDHQARLEARGVEVIMMPGDQHGQVSIEALLQELGRRKVMNLMVEGGSHVLGSFLESGHIQETWAFIGGMLIGGAEAPSPIDGDGVERISQALVTEVLSTEVFGNDILIKSRIKKN